MKKEFSRAEAKEKIESYFSGKLDRKMTRKMKRLAMKYKISLKEHKNKFCRKCLSDLSRGKVRITKGLKSIECECGHKNKFKIGC